MTTYIHSSISLNCNSDGFSESLKGLPNNMLQKEKEDAFGMQDIFSGQQPENQIFISLSLYCIFFYAYTEPS